MSRNFPDFLAAYESYANDGFCPGSFVRWTGHSIVAGALERKMRLPWEDGLDYYPNLYVLMVALPGIGKSTALRKGVSLLREMNLEFKRMNILPSRVTQAKFIELMQHSGTYVFNNKTFPHSSGYFYASEAADSLKDVYGDFLDTLTDLYDCHDIWQSSTKVSGTQTLYNSCLNVIACATFHYLSKLVTNDNVMGGFASRFVYVVHDEKLVRTAERGNKTEAEKKERAAYRRALVTDLSDIHAMAGDFQTTTEYDELWAAWRPTYESKRQDLPSEKMQSLLVRMNANVIKLSMILSASRSSDKLITGDDWIRALEYVEATTQKIPSLFRTGKALDVKSQEGLNQAIFAEFAKGPIANSQILRANLLLRNFPANMIEASINLYVKAGKLTNGDGGLKFLADPNEHF